MSAQINTAIQFTQNTLSDFSLLDNLNDDFQKDPIILIVPDVEQSALGKFEIRYSKKFDLGYTNPMPTEETLHLLYQDRQSGNFDPIQNSLIDYLKDFFAKKLLKKLRAGFSPDLANSCDFSLLDYSTGNGRFAWAAQQVFPQAQITATDFQASAPDFLNTKTSLNYLPLSDFLMPLPGQYDLILLRHVLEHSHHPIQLLAHLKNALKPHGVIYIEVPNLNSGCARVFKKLWASHYYAPYHLYHFTPGSLALALTKAGLEGEIIKTEMPKMGDMVAHILHRPSGLGIKLAGIALHPLQLLLGKLFGGSSCLGVQARSLKIPESSIS